MYPLLFRKDIEMSNQMKLLGIAAMLSCCLLIIGYLMVTVGPNWKMYLYSFKVKLGVKIDKRRIPRLLKLAITLLRTEDRWLEDIGLAFAAMVADGGTILSQTNDKTYDPKEAIIPILSFYLRIMKKASKDAYKALLVMDNHIDAWLDLSDKEKEQWADWFWSVTPPNIQFENQRYLLRKQFEDPAARDSVFQIIEDVL